MEISRELTKVELQLMQVLWEMKEASVNDILEALPLPKPAYNTVSTFMRILVNKQFIGFKAVGKYHLYYPLINRESYMENYLNGVKNTFFSGSLRSMISFFAKKEQLSKSELEGIIKILNDNNPES